MSPTRTVAYRGGHIEQLGSLAVDVLLWVLIGVAAWVVVGFLVSWAVGRMIVNRDRHRH